MCGITGVYSNMAVFKALLIMLEQLERGTKGAGVAWVEGGEIKIRKAPRHPANFVLTNFNKVNLRARVAIAHNRQPSMGKVCYENTHPFLACNREFALVHNGSMHNHNLRDKLVKNGHKIMGETDSEVIMHLLEDLLDEYGDMKSALDALWESGLNGAILVLTRKGEIYGIRRGQWPIVYGRNDEGVYIASTEYALTSVIHDVKCNSLESGKILIVRDGKFRVVGETKEQDYKYDYRFIYNPRYYPVLDDDSIFY